MQEKIENLIFFWKRLTKEMGNTTYVFAIGYVIMNALASTFSVMIAAKTIDIIASGKSVKEILVTLFLTILSFALVQIFKETFSIKLDEKLFIYRIVESPLLSFHEMQLPYEYISSPRGKNDLGKCINAVLAGNQKGVEAFFTYFIYFISDIINLIIYALLSVSLHPLILFLLLFTGSIRLWKDYKNQTWYRKNTDELNSWFYREYYLQQKCMDKTIGKDVRIYSLKDWFDQKFTFIRDNMIKNSSIIGRNEATAKNIGTFSGLIRDIVCYGYLIYRMTLGMSVSEFVLYLGVISGINQWIENAFKDYTGFCDNTIIVNDYRLYLKRLKLGEGNYPISVPVNKEYTYSFEDVTFGYEEGKPLFEHFNLTIKAGEKVALVGSNGAGKTTLVKLMVGILRPQEGRILLNGKDIDKMNPIELYKITGVLFQEAKIFPNSIAENVSCLPKDATVSDRVWDSLKKAGLSEYINNLPNKEWTLLTKTFDEDGTELSGGQYQRLMLARALYKDAPVLILDEPTAALDPLAEAELYEKYLSFTKGKTSIFISHRLSSTQFCNRVLFLENGRIVQDNTHTKLLEEDGPYRTMFQTQAYYYQEEVGMDER